MHHILIQEMSLDDLIQRDSQNNETLNVHVDDHTDIALCNLFNELRDNTTVKKYGLERRLAPLILFLT